MNKQKFALKDVLSVFLRTSLSESLTSVFKLLEFLTGQNPTLRNHYELSIRAYPELLRQCPALSDIDLPLLHASLLKDLDKPNGKPSKEIRRWHLVVMEATLGIKEVQLAAPFLPHLACQIIKTIASGVSNQNKLKRHPNLREYSSAAKTRCLRQLLAERVISKYGNDYRVKIMPDK